MKVAVCFSGHLRDYKKCYQSIYDNIISPLNADVFCHTWDVLGAFNTKGELDRPYHRKLTHDEKQGFLNLYKPTKFIIDTNEWSPLSEADRKFLETLSGPHPHMFYSVKAANDLKTQYEHQNKFKYDLVIRARYDFNFFTKLDLNAFSKKDSLIYVSSLGNYHGGVSDQFAASNSNNMNIYCSLYDDIVKIFRKSNRNSSPEITLRDFLNEKRIKIEHLPLNYDIVRLNGQILKQTFNGCWTV